MPLLSWSTSSGPVPHARLLLPALLVLLFTSSLTTALTCTPCYEFTCEELLAGTCNGSTVLEPCGCCQECARQRNETCGGLFGLSGTCDHGLRCVIRPLDNIYVAFGQVGVCEDITSSNQTTPTTSATAPNTTTSTTTPTTAGTGLTTPTTGPTTTPTGQTTTPTTTGPITAPTTTNTTTLTANSTPATNGTSPPITTPPPTGSRHVIGLRMGVSSKTPLTHEDIKNIVLPQLKEELVRRGIPPDKAADIILKLTKVQDKK